MTSHSEETHVAPYGLYVKVWAVLVILTIVTVGVCYADLAHMAIITALMIATIKSSLVLLYFMHVRYEKPIIGVMIIAALATYATFVILTFADYSYR